MTVRSAATDCQVAWVRGVSTKPPLARSRPCRTGSASARCRSVVSQRSRSLGKGQVAAEFAAAQPQLPVAQFHRVAHNFVAATVRRGRITTLVEQAEHELAFGLHAVRHRPDDAAEPCPFSHVLSCSRGTPLFTRRVPGHAPFRGSGMQLAQTELAFQLACGHLRPLEIVVGAGPRAVTTNQAHRDVHMVIAGRRSTVSDRDPLAIAAAIAVTIEAHLGDETGGDL